MAINATIIADSVSAAGVRNTTFQVEAPRFILAEINTHRIVAKSAASSRAIPVKKRIEMVKQDPFVPHAFGKNRSGMQATEELDEYASALALDVWHQGIDYALAIADSLDFIGTHKQLANRVLEPYCFFTGVLSASEWDNFWHLRIHPDAQPEFDELAKKMKSVLDASVPQRSQHHLPYTDDCRDLPLAERFMISSARCARVSYKSFETGLNSLPKDDIELCEKLITSGHLSPFDHAATADDVYHDDYQMGRRWCAPRQHRHLYGWIPYRVQVEARMGRKCKRDSHDLILDEDLYQGPVSEALN